MVFEVVGALVIWFAIAIGVRIYSRSYTRKQSGDARFQQWCRTRPRLAYFAVRPEALHLVRRALLEEFSVAHPVAVGQGAKPWPSHQLELDIERAAPDLLVLVLASGKPLRGQARTTELLTLVERACGNAPQAIVEIWLHGQLHHGRHGSKLDRDRVGWIGRPDSTGLHLELMVGTPAWTQARSRAA